MMLEGNLLLDLGTTLLVLNCYLIQHLPWRDGGGCLRILKRSTCPSREQRSWLLSDPTLANLIGTDIC